ncbi:MULTISPECIES: F510_1955 family glycosylhydrolase [unclassified Streptomyces]|uniref:F510_1955 family glycosylhydrolase n=1 Tax=unclassified Streptomyces TaxID=2593676 RepID=UPI0022B6BC55|nr:MULTISPECIES: exo-alpha-sialidase [unclassified Streptomyces]MCZ7415714.1 exo-alpha-sialidase [Streptomyces sp. WMMC897]MCZ7434475.1 exo-alpha-sialidase [Streptomyces sp. WMMC1477]
MSTQRTPARRSSARRLAAAAAAVAAALTLAACGAGGSNASDGHGGPDGDPGTGHLHGLGLDPADGTVYAAGHFGVFRLADGEATRIADRHQDTMGFTVTGPGTFLGSGHPAMDDPGATSPHLGLIRSTDAGKTWTTVSAEGEADFHSLQPAGEVLYAYDSQSRRVWSSADGGRTWRFGAEEDVADLAAHPSRPQEVWATGGQGLRRSADGGRTFADVPQAPALVAVDRPEGEGFVGLAPDGTVLASRDGLKWAEAGALPEGAEPTVLHAASPDRLLAADADGKVYSSRDGGRDWELLYAPDGIG